MDRFEAGYSKGVSDVRESVLTAFIQWAVTHPNPVVEDELWQFVNLIREGKVGNVSVEN